MSTVDIDDVEAGRPGPDGTVDVVLLDPLDVVHVHGPGIDVGLELGRDLRRRARGVSRDSWHGAWGPPYQSSIPAERAVLMQPVAHRLQILDVTVVPDPSRDAHGVIGLGADRAVLRAARRPTTLGFDAPVIGLHSRLLGPCTDAVRHLIEAVPEGLRPDLDRLEKHVVLGVTGHGNLLSLLG